MIDRLTFRTALLIVATMAGVVGFASAMWVLTHPAPRPTPAETVLAFQDGLNDQDCEAMLAVAAHAGSCDGVSFEGLWDNSVQADFSIGYTEVAGDDATVYLNLRAKKDADTFDFGLTFRAELVRVDGDWKISAFDIPALEKPDKPGKGDKKGGSGKKGPRTQEAAATPR